MKQVTAELGELIRELGITSVVDAPCGDFNWMQDVDLAGASYWGCEHRRGSNQRQLRPASGTGTYLSGA